MDHNARDAADDPSIDALMSRRAFFGRALMAAGATGALFGLTGCPGGGDDDEDGEDGDDD